jgi:hypothetical protein
MQVTLTANDANATSYALSTPPWHITTWDWGNAIWEQAWSGPRGTLGRQPTSSEVQNRQVALGLRLLPAAATDMPGHVSDLANIVELMRRYGGRVTVTTNTSPYRQHLRVFSSTAQLQDWRNRAEWGGRVEFALTFIAAPYVEGDPMGAFIDLGNSQPATDWTFDSGSASNIVLSSSGEWQPANASINVRAMWTAYGYEYGDVRCLLTVVPGSTITNLVAGVVLKRVSANTFLVCYVDDTGSVSRIRIDRVVSGATTNLASSNLATRISTGKPFRVAGSIEGNIVRANVFQGFIALADFDRAPDASISAVLSGSDVAVFGHNVTGRVGVTWKPQATNCFIDDFSVQPFWYDVGAPVADIVMRGDIPGDAPATAQIEVVANVGSATPKRAVIGFARSPANRNYLSDGSFEFGLTGNVSRPWTVAASPLTGAATSIEYAAPGRFGSACAQVVAPATANSGASSPVYGPFYAGVTYQASVWVRSENNTTSTRLRFGTSSDNSSTSGVALSTTWTQKTIDWTPATTNYVAWIAVEQLAATATTWQMDWAQVIEVGRTPTLVSQDRGRGGRPGYALLAPQDAIPAWPFTVVTASGWPNVLGAVLRVSTSSSPAVARWRLDPSLSDPQHHTGALEMEVWAWVMAPDTTWESPKLIASLAGSSAGEPTYTREYGATGYTPGGIGAAGSGLHRLGTLAVPVEENMQVDLVLRATCISMVGNLDIPFVVLVPPHRRVIAHGTPGLMPHVPTGYTTAVQVFEDGLARVRTYLEPGWSATPGVGQTIEVDPGECELIFAMQGTTAYNFPDLTMIRLTPTPRWHYVRDE